MREANMQIRDIKLAGAAGIEPANDGIKTRCLTTWLRPNMRSDEVFSGSAILCPSKRPQSTMPQHSDTFWRLQCLFASQPKKPV